MSKLEVGDVFELTLGMQVYITLPSKFVYSNRFDGNEDAEEPATTDIKVGDLFQTNPNPLLIGTKKTFDSCTIAGHYIVVKTQMEGGGYGHGIHDVYPDGWHVTARKLNGDEYDPEGQIVTFYQSGAFTAMNVNVPVIRKMAIGFK